MVGKEGCDIVDICTNSYIAGVVAVVRSNILRRNGRKPYTRHDDGRDEEKTRIEGIEGFRLRKRRKQKNKASIMNNQSIIEAVSKS